MDEFYYVPIILIFIFLIINTLFHRDFKNIVLETHLQLINNFHSIFIEMLK